jgi:hypothetical protein
MFIFMTVIKIKFLRRNIMKTEFLKLLDKFTIDHDSWTNEELASYLSENTAIVSSLDLSKKDLIEEFKICNEALDNSMKLNKNLQNEIDILVKYHPSINYPCQISNPYGVFFCKKEEDYDELAKGDYCFARKFHGKESAKLKEKIIENLW